MITSSEKSSYVSLSFIHSNRKSLLSMFICSTSHRLPCSSSSVITSPFRDSTSAPTKRILPRSVPAPHQLSITVRSQDCGASSHASAVVWSWNGPKKDTERMMAMAMVMILETFFILIYLFLILQVSSDSDSGDEHKRAGDCFAYVLAVYGIDEIICAYSSEHNDSGDNRHDILSLP